MYLHLVHMVKKERVKDLTCMFQEINRSQYKIARHWLAQNDSLFR